MTAPRTATAWCWASGLIEIVAGKAPIPEGALPIARGPARKLRTVISVNARHSRDGKALLVPGVPEADDEFAAVDALTYFVGTVERRLAGENGWGPR